MKIAIIPARGGSKRIPRKNIREFCGKPMIEWPISIAKASGIFDNIIISTDDPEIAAVSKAAGAEVPFIRPSELASDYTATRPVINHAILEIEKIYGLPEFVCCIYATAPFITVDALERGLEILTTNKSDFAFAATSFQFPIQRAFKINEMGSIEILYPEYLYTRSQELPDAYHDAGQFYWGKTEAFLAGKPALSGSSVPIILPRYKVCDIDTEEDWKMAEIQFKVINHIQMT